MRLLLNRLAASVVVLAAALLPALVTKLGGVDWIGEHRWLMRVASVPPEILLGFQPPTPLLLAPLALLTPAVALWLLYARADPDERRGATIAALVAAACSEDPARRPRDGAALLEAFTAGYLSSQYKDAVAFVVILAVLFFSVSQSKLIPYILPVFPPLAVLLGAWLSGVMEKDARAELRPGAWIFSAAIATGTLSRPSRDRAARISSRSHCAASTSPAAPPIRKNAA